MDVRVAAPEAEAELAVGFFGSRYERATPAEREYMRIMAQLAAASPGGAKGVKGAEGEEAPEAAEHAEASEEAASADVDAPVVTADIARALGRKPASLSPARDALIKKGLIYSGERGTVAFTVPHFGRFLRSQDH